MSDTYTFPDAATIVEEASEVAYEYEYSDKMSIEVTFTKNDITHIRPVNNSGDVESFEQRVKEVSYGVQNKIACGCIRHPSIEEGSNE